MWGKKFSFLNQINRLQDKLYLKGKIYLNQKDMEQDSFGLIYESQ